MPLLDHGLIHLGWDDDFAGTASSASFDGAAPARAIADYGADYLVDGGDGAFRAAARGCDPAVGDWVMVRGGSIVEVLRRRTAFVRRSAGAENRPQVLAANVDVAFVVAVATDVNVRRLERYLTIAWQSGATPVVLVTKSDLAEDLPGIRSAVEGAAPRVAVVTSSGVSGAGVAEVARMLRPARTGVLLGPSGTGKSTLVNRLAGRDVMRTREIHGGSGEGRHMTSHRQLILLPGGGMIIDTPGLREAQLWLGDGALGDAFHDVEELAGRCRFADCAHRSEPGCAVREALATGALDSGRFASYVKLQRELRSIEARSDARLRADERRKWRQIAVANRARERYLRR